MAQFGCEEIHPYPILISQSFPFIFLVVDVSRLCKALITFPATKVKGRGKLGCDNIQGCHGEGINLGKTSGVSCIKPNARRN